MDIKFNEDTYELNVEKAIELGFLIKKKRTIQVKDIKNGTLFRYRDPDGRYRYYLMLDNTIYESGQCCRIPDMTNTYLLPKTKGAEVFNSVTKSWISEI